MQTHRLGGGEEGLLIGMDGHLQLMRHQLVPALALSEQAIAVGLAVGSPDVVALSRLTVGWAHLRLGRRAEALAAFDEVLVATTAGETSPAVAVPSTAR